MDNHHQVGGVFAHSNTEPPHLFRQSRFGNRNAVLHENLSLVDIRSGLKDNVNGRHAVARRLRNNIKHALDAVYFLFERCGNGVCDNFS